MTQPPPTLTLSRLEQLLDAYGGDPASWPEQERAAALALIETEPEARKLHASSQALDAKLSFSDLSEVVSSQLRARVLEIPIKHAAIAPARAPRFGMFAALFAMVPCMLGFLTGNLWLDPSSDDEDDWSEIAEVASLSSPADLFDDEELP